MKSTPFLIACVVVMCAMLSILSVTLMSRPAAAQDAGDGQVKGVSALTVATGGGREFLVILKEVENGDNSAEEAFKRVTAMAIYDFENTTAGQGKAKLKLVASRFVDYDLMFEDFSNEKGQEVSLEKAKETYRDVLTRRAKSKEREDKKKK